MPFLGPIAAALRDEPTLEAIREKLSEGKAKPTEAATLVVADKDNNSILVERDDWHVWWRAYRRGMADDRKSKVSPSRRNNASSDAELSHGMRCLLSGELVEPLATHSKIERLSDVGGLSMGDSLVSFDKEAFTSYSLEQGANAAVGETMAKTYVTALNHLIRYQSRRLAGVKVVYWYSGRIEAK